MLLILPPSETKRDGGAEGSSLDLTSLGFATLTPQREATIAALRRLARSVSDSTHALGLGPTQRFEIDRNRALLSSPTMPAIDRYSGVVYDALETGTLDARARQFASEHVVIGSALFGLLRATDAIPAYRLSHDSQLGTLRLRRHWASAVEATLAATTGVVLDLRSEAYAALGVAPARNNSLYLRVVTATVGGRRIALSHANKHAKGAFTRSLVDSGLVHESIESIIDWGENSGYVLERGAPGELNLVV